MMKKYMIIMSFLIAWTTSLWAENSTLPLTVTPGADGSVHLVSAVPAEVTGSVISKGFEYRLKGTGAWTTVSAAGAFEADIAVPVGTHEFRVFAEVSGQGMLYSRTNQVMVVGGYDNNAGTLTCTVDETPIAATATAGTYQIAVNCDGAWTALVENAGNHAWCTLTNASGTNAGAITVHVAENPLFTTRSATVKITGGEITKSVVINQNAAEDIGYPIVIPFTDYSLAGTSCQWECTSDGFNWLCTNPELDKINVINSDEELKNHINCSGGNYPKFDFSKYSLIYVKGWTPSRPTGVIGTQLLQTSDNEYSLHLDIRAGPQGSGGCWYVSIIVPKLPQNAIFTLTKKYFFY